ncbi:hypothetical protein ACI1US_01843 [Leucobacter sp. BZR 635]
MSTSGSPAEPAAKPAGRPRKSYRTDAVTIWLRRGSIALTVGSALAVVSGYASLPDEIPIHFNLAGTADGWGSKSNVFLLIGIFVVIVSGSVWLSSKPHLFNYPTEITVESAQAVYREGERIMVWLAFVVSLIAVSFALSTLFEIDLGFFTLFMAAAALGVTGVGVVRIINASH